MTLQYKFVELSTVTDDKIEECVNDWVGQGWTFEGIRFAMQEHSKRPAMAFVSFTGRPLALPSVPRPGAGGLAAPVRAGRRWSAPRHRSP